MGGYNYTQMSQGVAMLSDRPLAHPMAAAVAVPLVSLVLWYVVSYYKSPLRKYPGPFLAGWTNYYRMWYAYQGNLHTVTKELHRKYGPIVRMAPNYLDLDCPSLLKTCFDIHGVWAKTEWHAVSGAVVDGQTYYNIFSEVRASEHSRMKKPIAKYFSAAGVAPLEPHVDVVIGLLCKRLAETFAGDGTKQGEPLDFTSWTTFFSWDAVAKITWSHVVGYLEKGYDFDGSIEISDKAVDYLTLIGMNPILDKFLDKNPFIRIGPPSFRDVTNLGLSHLMGRMKGEDGHDPAKPDFLDFYLEAKEKHPEVVDVYRILSYMLVNIAAGADTIALTLRSVFYLSLVNPHVYARLRDEIMSAEMSHYPISFAEARQMPYLDAVIHECTRYLPGSCFPLERYVPEGGLQLPDGSRLSKGTAVGFNAYVLHRNKEFWGEDAEEFRPERWLQAPGESSEKFQERLQAMNNVDMSFSKGSRKCIGMNVGKLEVFKTVATLIRLFEFELADPSKPWKINNRLFPRQSGVVLKLTKRTTTDSIIAKMDLTY